MWKTTGAAAGRAMDTAVTAGSGDQCGWVGGEELAAESGDDDVESFVEFGGAVVGGEDAGE